MRVRPAKIVPLTGANTFAWPRHPARGAGEKPHDCASLALHSLCLPSHAQSGPVLPSVIGFDYFPGSLGITFSDP